MFYYISGKLARLDPTFAVIDVNGIGYKLTISETTRIAMPSYLTASEPPTVKLFTYMSVREDDVELFGFASEEELSAFKLLITVSGVGPKVAISILSQLSPQKLAIAVCSDDQKAIAKANGIGPKTAARIVIDLKDKFAKENVTYSNDVVPQLKDDIGNMSVSNKRRDAEDALTVLGYSKGEAASVLRTVDTETLELDEIIRLALKKLMR